MMRILSLLLVTCATLSAQHVFSERVKGFRMYGTSEEKLPIAFLSSRPVTIEFDLTDSQPANMEIRFFHCDRNWRRTETRFINDEILMRSKFALPYQSAPQGVEQYRFTYKVNVPSYPVFDQFPASGNYEVEVWDIERKEHLATGRFFVVERVVTPGLTIENRLLPSTDHPWNQGHRIKARVVVGARDSLDDQPLYPILLTTVDVYKNREFGRQIRVDVSDVNPNTFVEGLGTRTMVFVVDNALPGNEYRRLDLRIVNDHPITTPLHRLRGGADVSRFLKSAPADNNGASFLLSGTRSADYLKFQFEFWDDRWEVDSVYVVGTFNGWEVSERSLMQRTDHGRFTLPVTLKRGIHEYQYVLRSGDWVSLEGNDWRTVNLYTAFVYYRDQRFGGFDRIVGFAQGSSTRSVTPTSH
jgi:hypothetical protein